jgi:cytochrome c biogenesis protein CcmG/thiol:disulfide interchange protein DsbE
MQTMRRTTILRIIPAALLLAACGDAPGGGRAGGPVRVGAEAPAYAAETMDGERAAISQLRGRPVLLNVWATWCHPCRQEIPALEQLHRTYAPRGLHVVGVSIDQGDQQQGIREFLQEYGASYPIWLDPDGEIQTAYSTMGVPNTFLIGPDGTVLWKHVGPVTADNPELVRLIEKSLPAAS